MSGIEERLYTKLLKKGEPSPLPDFAKWFVELGRKLFEAQETGSPRVVSLVVPSRRYLAAFIALGALDAAIRSASTRATEPEPGTHVRAVFPDGRVLIGLYLGRETKTVLKRTTDYYVIDLKDQKRELIPIGMAHLEPLHAADTKATGFEGSTVPGWFKVVQDAYGVGLLSARLSAIRDVAVILGVKARIEDEISGLDLYLEAQGTPVPMSDLLLTAPGKLYDAVVKVLSSKAGSDEYTSNSVVILDGERAAIVDSGCRSATVLLEATSPATASIASGIQSSLQFLSPDHDWPRGFSHPAPKVEWTCHRR